MTSAPVEGGGTVLRRRHASRCAVETIVLFTLLPAACGRVGYQTAAPSLDAAPTTADLGSPSVDVMEPSFDGSPVPLDAAAPSLDATPDHMTPDLTPPPDTSTGDAGGTPDASAQQPGTVITIAGTGVAGADDGPISTATFRAPRDVLVAPEGIYVADRGNLALRLIMPDGRVRTIAGGGGAGYVDGTGAAARFRNLGTLARLADGSLIVSDDFNHALRRVTPAGEVSTFAGTGTRGYAEGPRLAAQFAEPGEAYLAPDGTVYVADKLNRVIRSIGVDGTTTLACGTPGAPAAVVDGRCGADARFGFPSGIEGDDKGNLYVAEFIPHVVRRIAPDGTVTTLLGKNGVPGWADGTPDQVILTSPARLRFDRRTGLLWIQEQDGGHRLRSWDGRVVVTVFGPRDPGRVEPAYQDGADARFCHADGFDIDEGGCLIVADNCNQRIRRACPP